MMACQHLAQVFDHVLAPSTCQYLHTASSIGELGDEMHTVYERHKEKPATAIERCIHSILLALGDESACVEYWWRDSWVHVEAHEDLDEELFEQQNVREFPTNAHVLYLSVGHAVQGPTCVWEKDDEHDFGVLTTVPAVDGRLLRFPGSWMHAVPKPAHAWLDASAGAAASTPSPQAQTKADRVRSVILFNTWPEPPLDVPRAGARDPRTVIQGLAQEFSSPKLDAMARIMESPDELCLSRSEWREVAPKEGSGAATTTMRVSLLGEEVRRKQPEPVLELEVPAGVSSALVEEQAVTRFGRHELEVSM
jgi:hypothetical protein